MLTNLIFLVLENFMNNSDRTPPYIDTYLKLFPNFLLMMEKTLFYDKNEPNYCHRKTATFNH